MLTELEKKIISLIQGDIPVTKRPYLELANRLMISENQLLQKLKDLCNRGIIRRFGATIRHQKSGFEANAMVAWRVAEDRVDEVGEKLASYRQVTHCYRRNPSDNWPYNIYTMIHAKNEDTCKDLVKRMSEKISVETFTILFSQKELKKTSMKYFQSDCDR
ncbi:MAG: Lrp/AsnC family transcriptional regulator [Deltaproteobacteria bacterium]|nr:MAG: Lrp/AsnC family transcriptional regulator [Deltaproteobacteria bacterium]